MTSNYPLIYVIALFDSLLGKPNYIGVYTSLDIAKNDFETDKGRLNHNRGTLSGPYELADGVDLVPALRGGNVIDKFEK